MLRRLEPGGRYHFMFQICEMRKHVLLEGHVRCAAPPPSALRATPHPSSASMYIVRAWNRGSGRGKQLTSRRGRCRWRRGRCYAVRRDYDYLATGQTAHCQPFVMRLQHPDDELGAMLLMNLPSVVVHAVDNWSPLAPRPTERRW